MPQLSLLEFNGRVLAVAEDVRTPLLERLRYLAILSANLDEFYMRPGRDVAPDRVEELLARQQRCIARLPGAPGGAGPPAPAVGTLSATDDRETLRARFRREFFPR